MICSGIYALLNIVTGKYYVGSAFNFKLRWKNHLVELKLNRHHSQHLQSAYNKYGVDSFIFVILEYVEDKSNITKYEQRWMDELKAHDREFGYNVCAIAGNRAGCKASPDTLGLLSFLRTGVPRSEETKRKISEAQKGKFVSEETKKKQSLAHIGKKLSKETKAKMSAQRIGNKFNLGRKQSAEQIARRTSFLIGRVVSEETRAKLSAAHVGRIISEDTRRKMSISAKNRKKPIDICLNVPV